MNREHLYANKLTWQERRDIANKAYRPSNNSMAIDVRQLRQSIFHDQKIPLETRMWANVEVFNTHGTPIGHLNIEVRASKSVGDMKTRGGRGHRMFVQCPACGSEHPNMIPVGRLHQHYGYKHA